MESRHSGTVSGTRPLPHEQPLTVWKSRVHGLVDKIFSIVRCLWLKLLSPVAYLPRPFRRGFLLHSCVGQGSVFLTIFSAEKRHSAYGKPPSKTFPILLDICPTPFHQENMRKSRHCCVCGLGPACKMFPGFSLVRKSFPVKAESDCGRFVGHSYHRLSQLIDCQRTPYLTASIKTITYS